MSDFNEPVGDFPPVLYKAFDEDRWARAFVEEGRMRFRTLQYYAQLENDPRADQSEGNAHLQIAAEVESVHLDRDGKFLGITKAPGYLNYQGEFVNAIFVYCFSHPPDGAASGLPKHFGDHLVRIDDPKQLARDVVEWMTRDGTLRDKPVIECLRVVYDKGEKREKEPSHAERLQLHMGQKPPSYSAECEYRFVTIDPRPRGDRVLENESYDVVLGRPLPYASIVKP